MIGPPTLAGFQYFLANYVGVSTSILPPDAPVVEFSFNLALAIVNPVLAQVGQPPCSIGQPSGLLYNNAVYNLGTDYVFNYAQDLPNAPLIEGSNPPAAYFQNARQVWNINNFVAGVVQASSDNGTSQSLLVQEAAKNFTIANLQNLKTPWGRNYLAIAQSFGPTPYGIN